MSTFYGRFCHHINIAVILLAVWISYGTCLEFNFVWDDFGLIVYNEQVQSEKSWPNFFTQDFWTIGENVKDTGRSFYRPLISLSYGIDYKMWGMNPFGFHLTNMVAHSLSAVIVYMLGILLLKIPLPVATGTLLWAIHPTHVENVCWISGRTDVLCAVFLLLAFLMFEWWVQRGRLELLLPFMVLLCYSAALSCKEAAVMFPVLCAADLFFLDGGLKALKKRRTYLLLLCLVTILYLFVRSVILGSAIGGAAYGTVWQKLISIPFVLAQYIGLLFTLVPIDVHHNEKLLESIFSVRFLVSMLVCIFVLAGLIMLWRHGRRKELFLASWFFVLLAPVLHLGSFGDVIYADRFLYIPSIGFFMLFSVLVRDAMPSFRYVTKLFGKILAIIAVLYATLLIGYSRYTSGCWKDGTLLFYRAAKTSPDSAYVHFNLGQSLMHQSAYYRAYESYKKALALQSGYGEAHLNAGAALNKVGAYEKAFKHLKYAERLGVNPDITYATMGDSWVGLGNYKKAEAHYVMSLIVKESSRAHNNLGFCFLKQGKLDKAEAHFARGVELGPVPHSYNNLAKLAIERGDGGKAITHLEQAMAFNAREIPSDLLTDIYYNMARAQAMAGNKPSGHEYAELALQLISEGKGPAGLRDELIQLVK